MNYFEVVFRQVIQNLKHRLTMFVNSNEHGLVTISIPPFNWDIIVVNLRHPDFQLTIHQGVVKREENKAERVRQWERQSSCNIQTGRHMATKRDIITQRDGQNNSMPLEIINKSNLRIETFHSSAPNKTLLFMSHSATLPEGELQISLPLAWEVLLMSPRKTLC